MPKRRVFVVCTNQENGEYMAFDAADPAQSVTTYSDEGAIAGFAVKYMTDVVEIVKLPRG